MSARLGSLSLSEGSLESFERLKAGNPMLPALNVLPSKPSITGLGVRSLVGDARVLKFGVFSIMFSSV